MEIYIIIRENSPNNIGSFLLEHKEVLKKNCRFSIHRKSSEEEMKLRDKLKIQSLPIIIVKGKIIQGEQNIIRCLIQIVKSFQENESEEYSDWYQNKVDEFKNKVENKKNIDDDNDDVFDFEKDLNKKIEMFNTEKEGITNSEAKKFKCKPTINNVENTFEKEFKNNIYLENNNITEDEIDLEKWMNNIAGRTK